MDPVISNILARQSSSSFEDKNKISLVLFGGLMCGIRGAASVIALTELGLVNAFDSIHTISAGFANASYFLSGQVREGTSIYYDDLKDRNFINFFRPWKIADIDFLVDVMSNKKKLYFDRVLQSKTNVFVQLLNTDNNKVEYLEIHKVKHEEFMPLLKAAISVPYLFPGSTQVGESHYTDPDLSDKTFLEQIRKVYESDSTDILIIYNTIEQYNIVKKADLKTDKRVYSIFPDPSWKLSRICTDGEKLKSSAQQMGDLVKNCFGFKESIQLNY